MLFRSKFSAGKNTVAPTFPASTTADRYGVLTIANKKMNVDEFIAGCGNPNGEVLSWVFQNGKGTVKEEDYSRTNMADILSIALTAVSQDGTVTKYYSYVDSTSSPAPEGPGVDIAEMTKDVMVYLDGNTNIKAEDLTTIQNQVDEVVRDYANAVASGDESAIEAAEGRVENMRLITRAVANLFTLNGGDFGGLSKGTDSGANDEQMVSATQMKTLIENNLNTYTDGVTLTSLRVLKGTVAANGYVLNANPADGRYKATDGKEYQIQAATWEAKLTKGNETVTVTWNWVYPSLKLTYDQVYGLFNPVDGDYVVGGNKTGLNEGKVKLESGVGSVATEADIWVVQPK